MSPATVIWWGLSLLFFVGCQRGETPPEPPEAGSQTPSSPLNVEAPAEPLASATKAGTTPTSESSDQLEESNDQGVSDNDLRWAELSAILASRTPPLQHPTNTPRWPIDVQEPPESLRRAIQDAGILNVHVSRVCGVDMPSVTLNAERPEHLEHLLRVPCNTPLELVFPINVVTTQWLTRLNESPALQIGRLSVSLADPNTDDYSLLGRLPGIKALRLGHGFSQKQVIEILANDQLESLSIGHVPSLFVEGNSEFSGEFEAALKSQRNLKRIEFLTQTSDIRVSMSPIWRALTVLPQLESLRINAGHTTNEDIAGFLGQGTHDKLQALIVTSEPLSYPTNDLRRCPNLEELSLCILEGDHWSLWAVRSQRRVNRETSIRKLKLIPMTREGTEVEALSEAESRSLIGELSWLPTVEVLEVPFKITSSEDLEPFTRMDRLQTLPVINLDLNRETLGYLCRMPELKHLTVESLDFGPECAHLMPWLRIEGLHVGKPGTLNNERAQLLARSPRLRHIGWWGGNGMTVDPKNITHIMFQEYD